jgi:hypothetical protein
MVSLYSCWHLLMGQPEWLVLLISLFSFFVDSDEGFPDTACLSAPQTFSFVTWHAGRRIFLSGNMQKAAPCRGRPWLKTIARALKPNAVSRGFPVRKEPNMIAHPGGMRPRSPQCLT